MYHEYPYTTYFHDIDKMCNACNKAGYRLEVSGDYLKLIDEKGNVISNVKISYAEKALTDVDGTPIRAYIVSAAAGESTLVFQHGEKIHYLLSISWNNMNLNYRHFLMRILQVLLDGTSAERFRLKIISI